MADKLSELQIKTALENLQGWQLKEGSIKKVYKTSSYPVSMGLVTAIGGICQKYNHHPDYILMKYKEVEISFSTHSVNGITQKDIDIATDVEKIPIL
jgi:4a-hydroxytetrahydrobiopterin dehydratase